MEGKLVAAGLVMVIAGLPVTTRAAQPANPPIEIIGESSGPPPQPICEGPGCATVLSIRYQGEEWVPVASEDGPGTYVGAAEGIAIGPPGAPLLVGESALDKDEKIWMITVRFRNGAMETIPQNFPPLFQRGDWVFVEGNSIRFAQ
ncbi:MAG: hypothetical protein ABWY12_04475 [Burkholderiales bacterium]